MKLLILMGFVLNFQNCILAKEHKGKNDSFLGTYIKPENLSAERLLKEIFFEVDSKLANDTLEELRNIISHADYYYYKSWIKSMEYNDEDRLSLLIKADKLGHKIAGEEIYDEYINTDSKLALE